MRLLFFEFVNILMDHQLNCHLSSPSISRLQVDSWTVNWDHAIAVTGCRPALSLFSPFLVKCKWRQNFPGCFSMNGQSIKQMNKTVLRDSAGIAEKTNQRVGINVCTFNLFITVSQIESAWCTCVHSHALKVNRVQVNQAEKKCKDQQADWWRNMWIFLVAFSQSSKQWQMMRAAIKVQPRGGSAFFFFRHSIN